MADDSEWLKLPPDEKVQHKNWKARVAGYEEVTKLFGNIVDEKSSEFSKYAGLVKKFVMDSNAVAQEKGVEAAMVFVEKAAIAHKTAADVVSGVIAKCISAPKQKTRDGGKEIIMLYVEAEKQEAVEECLIEGLGSKNPKIVSACVQTLREALRNFGNKIIQIKPLLKFLSKLMEDRDKNVREEAKMLVVEMYRWVGAAIKPKLTDFKPVQIAELEAEFEKLPTEKAQQTRFLKSQQDLKAKMIEKAAMAEEGVEVEEEEGEEVDPYEMMVGVNVLAALPKDFFEKIEAKKWQERKEVLEAAVKLCESQKIESGDYGNFVRAILKVIGKDTNVMLVALGGKCLAGLARGLRKKFSPYATNSFSVILEKFKEKKPTVVAALRDAADQVYLSISLEPLQEDILAALENKNPSIKAETASFLGRAFSRLTLTTLPKKQLKAFCSVLLKTVNDTSPEVREASFMAIGTAMKVVTEKNIMAYLNDVDDIKMQKIKECCEKTVLLNVKGEPRSGGVVAKPTAAASAPAKSGPSIVKPGGPPPSSARPKTAPAKSGGPSQKAGGPPRSKAVAKKSAPAEEKTEKILSDEAFLEKASDFLTEDVLKQLESSNWKERLTGMERFRDMVSSMSKADIPCQVCVRAVAKKPGFKDNNFQVLKLRVELVSHLAENANFTKTSAEFCLVDLVEKVGDIKNGAAVQEAFSCIAEATSLDYVAGEVVKAAFAQKNPKNQSEALNWMSKAVTEFGLKVQVKSHIQYMKVAFAATNPAVRTAGIGLLCTLYMYMGQQLRMLFDGEKAALLQQIDSELEKVKGQKPPAPVRGVKPSDDDEGGDDEEAGGGRDENEDNIADLVQRNDIGDQFTPDIINAMSDKGWKVRGESLQKITAILNDAKFITGNLGPLPDAIKARLGDANKNLVTTTVGICVTLAMNMGPHCKHHVKTIGPALIGVLGDSKPTLRAAAVGALNAWVDQTTLTPLVECEAFSDALKLENPNLRQELLGWLSERLPNHKQLPKDEMKLCIPHLLACLEDRNPEVRKKGQEALVPFMIHVGYDVVFKATSKLKPASKDQILQIIEKARENLPAKQPKAKKAAPATKQVTARPPSDNFDESETTLATKDKSPTNDGDTGGDSKPKVPGKLKAKSAPPPGKRKKAEEDTSPPISSTESKEKRFKDEKNMKTLKWNFIEPRLEYVDQLRTQMEKNFSKAIMDQLFHSDFKFHIKAIETLQKCLESLRDEQVANLDLILKWFTLRFFDTNPSMLNKGLEYLTNLFKVLIDMDYNLHEYEATSFVPYLVIKVGENKDNVRRDVRALFKLVYKVYPPSKMFVFISDGIKCKNSKQRTECLEELGHLIEMYGITICQPSPAQALKYIASQISDRDNGVRNAALNTTVVAYLVLGDELYKYIGNLKEKEQSYLDERIKRSSKNKPAAVKQESRPKTAPAQTQRSATQGSVARPGTSVPKSQSSNSVKKEFQLDIEEDTEKTTFLMPKLNQYNDLDDLFKPVEFPKIIFVDNFKGILIFNRKLKAPKEKLSLNCTLLQINPFQDLVNGTIKARPPSPGAKFFNSVDASNTVNYVISQVTNREIQTCIQALAQIDEVLKDSDKMSVMVDHVEQLLVAMSMQFKMAFSAHMGDQDTSKDDVLRLYRCLLGTLLSLLQNSVLAVQASKDILKELISNLITMLLDNRLMQLDDGPQVVRSVNVLVIRIVEKSDQTNVFCALIGLLQEGVASETCSNKFLELIMKCLWKMVKMLPDTVDDLNLDQVLYDIHLFLRAFPTNTWKERSNDLPLRTVKTILHSMGKLKGSKILSHLGQIDAGEVSEVKTYLQKVLRNDGGQLGNTEINGTEDNQAPRSAQKTKRLSKSAHETLTEIIKKIGSKENTKEGLLCLYNFKKQFPDADVEPFLKKSSQFFQNYIERGLKAIEKEQRDKSPHISDRDVKKLQPFMDHDRVSGSGQESRLQKPKFALESNEGSNDPDTVVELKFYMEKLRTVRAKFGLDASEQTTKSENTSSPPVTKEPKPSQQLEESKPDEEEDSSSNIQSAASATRNKDVSDLKARLARLKVMANS